MKALRLMFLLATIMSVSKSWATVSISSPANNSAVSNSIHVVASVTTSTCSKGVAAVGVYVDDALTYTAQGTQLDTMISVSNGTHKLVVQGWDYCNGYSNGSVTVVASSSGGVTVTTPTDGATVTTTVPFVASSTSNCSSGVAAMGVYINDSLVSVSAGSSVNKTLSLAAGKQKAVVQSWDNCGNSSKTQLQLNVAGTTIYNIQNAPGWNQWGQLPPLYNICDAPCQGVNWSMTQNVSSTSLSGSAAQFYLGGTTPYSDVLFSNPILGQGNQQGRTDSNHSLLPTLHDFTSEMDVYVTNWSITQVLEFDINMYAGGVGMEWGTECNHLNGNVWDYWDNVNAQWIHTAAPCTLQNGWNHVVVQAHRGSNNEVTYQSITVNGTTYTLNVTVPAKTVPSGWWGMTLNYQMDGNYKMDGYSTFIDNFKFTYM